MLDAQTLINVLLASVLAAFGWFARQVWDAVKTLEKDVQALKVKLPTGYVTKEEFGDTMKRIEAMVQRIYDKLDEKMDKP